MKERPPAFAIFSRQSLTKRNINLQPRLTLTELFSSVLQVTGELSNNGEPMRRFMQTFVLAPQSHKKYYVHNDIFR